MITLETGRGKIIYAIGIDLGGTFIKSAVIDSRGKIHKKCRLDTLAEKEPKTVTRQIEKSIETLLRGLKPEVSGIGIGAPGIVTNGIVKFPPNFRRWGEVNVRKLIQKKFNIKTEIHNDANCAGIAEIKFGHGIKYKNFLFITLGTGIGGAMIIDGAIYRGEQNGAGEFGMMSVKFDGVHCLGGNPGSVEAYIGRNYFLENNREEINKISRGNRSKHPDFVNIAKYAAKGNKTAKYLFKLYGFYLGLGIVNYFNLMDVRTAVLAGGISNAYNHFIRECNRTIKERSLKTIRNKFRVLRSKVHNDVGVIGAAALLFTDKF